MARYVNEFQTGKNDQLIMQIAQYFLGKEGFSPYAYKEEYVYKKGIGALTAPQFIKITAANGTVHIEAFMKFAWLPGVYSGEMGLTGFFGALPKKLLKESVKRLELLLQQG